MADLLSREYEVNYSHIDNRGIAKPSFLWNIMQDAATVHAEELHLGPAELHILWVLSRMKVRLSRPLRPYERIRCETWCPGIRGVSWYRCFAFYAGEEPVGDAQSMWVTLDPESHRILRPSSFPVSEGYLHTARGELFDPLPKLSCETVREHHVHPVLYSDLDVNNHVNNVRVVSWYRTRSTCSASPALFPHSRSTTPLRPRSASSFPCSAARWTARAMCAARGTAGRASRRSPC